jgi:hypothetical protein
VAKKSSSSKARKPTHFVRLIAPFRCHFNLDHSAVTANEEGFAKLINALAEKLSPVSKDGLKARIPEGMEVRVKPIADNKNSPRYVSLESTGSHFHSPAYFDLHFTEKVQRSNHEEFLRAAAHADEVCGRVFSGRARLAEDSLFFSIYDHTIGILTLDLTLDEAGGAEHGKWAGLDAWTTHLVSHLLSAFYEKYVHPTLDAIVGYAVEHHPGFVKVPRQYVIFYDMNEEEHQRGQCSSGALLWVNRTLICPQGKGIPGWTACRLNEKDAVDVLRTKAYLYSGNSVVEYPAEYEPSELSNLWLGLYIAQYYYAVLDVISKNLSRFVGLSYVAESNAALRRLSDSMERVIIGVTIFQVKYKDIYQELQGSTRGVFQRLEKEWDFKAIFDNVQNKINLCKSNVTRLNQMINQRNQLRVQLVLSMVAGVTLINIMMQFSIYSQRLGEKFLRETEHVPGLLHLGLYLSPNSMIWIGIVLATMVVSTILYNRPR